MAFSSSFLSTFKYDVYVSFRGEDTGSGFTSHLLKALREGGINTFSNDNGQFQKGEETSSLLINPIQDSKIAIIVLSNNYASSRFRLEELSYILDNFRRNRHRLIIPIFYNVEPSDVRNLQGSYGYAFEMHDKRFKDNQQKVQKWRNALNQVANVSGFHFMDGNGYASESGLIESIVKSVSTGLFDHAPLHNAETVGLESPLKEVCSLLELNPNVAEVHMLGIYGATGIGKTTLAREVYNRVSHQFEASCFLPDVRENSNIHGLPHLQHMLLSEMIGWKDIKIQIASNGSSIIRHRLKEKKVLLILDDVDKLEQLEALVGGTDWFGSGSRIIVTTQDRHLLAFYRIERIYEVQPLNNRDALELLRQQIFKEGNADPSNTEILNELVTYAAGLPLALKVIGSYLFGKSVDEWTNALRQFKRIPPQDIQRKLKSSFDADPEGSHDTSAWFERVKWKTWFWRGVGTVSGVVGPLFFALSPPSKCVIRERKLLFILCSMWSLIICVFLHCVKPTQFSKRHRRPICYGVFLIVSAFSFFYDKAVNGKPSIQSVVSNGAFALVSLSKSKLDDLGFETVAVLQTSTSLDPHSSQGGAEQGNPPSDWETWFWRGVGTVSGVVGPLFFALSPPSKCVIEEWKKVLLIACSMWILVIWVFLHCAKPNLFPKQHSRYTGYVVFLIIATYSFFYDKAIDNKPSVYSVVSNAAFALVSLSKSKLDDLGFETGTFCYFLACCTIQLMGFESKFYLFGILLTCPLFLWHFPSKPQDETLPQYSKNTTRPKSETKLQNSGKKEE